MRSLHQVLSRTAAWAPDAIAVEQGDSRISYAELEDRASRLAASLRALGVRKGDRIGLLLAKCIDAYTAIFGILKAGAVLVPLDIRFPPMRIGEIARRCGMKLLVSDCERAALLASTRCQLVIVDGTEYVATAHRQAVHALDRLLQSGTHKRAPSFGSDGDLAYILFTSGSTGAPKGVAISHRAALWFVEWAAAQFQLTSDDRILNVAPFIFDLSVLDIYATLYAGGTIVPLPDGHVIFPVRVSETLAAQRITAVYLTPSQLRPLLARGMVEQHDMSALGRVLVAGEVLDVDLVRDLFQKLPRVACYNLYGPTETNVCTIHAVEPRALETEEEIPIGRPCRGCEILVAGNSGREVEEGGVGEILVRSPGVMTGYWQDSKATRRVLRRIRGKRGIRGVFYRTGDLAARNHDGELLFRGRKDRQVKHRGYRIELEEVEATLRSQPEVADALAVLVTGCRPGGAGGRLVAYVCLRARADLTPRDLLARCSEILPRFMIPEEIVVCDELPLSVTGKRPRVVSSGAGSTSVT